MASRMQPGDRAEAAVRERAPAKVNLDLLVTARRADGYHELDSLVVFADVADELTLTPADKLRLEVTGPFAGELPPAAQNIALRAAQLLARAAGRPDRVLIRLDKRLPVAAGIGGGSADAAAVLRGLRRLWAAPLDDAALAALGRELGADLPVCLHGRPARMRGVGERVEPCAALPALDLVLVNPRQPLATAAVFKALPAELRGIRAEEPPAGPALAWLHRGRNDLEAPARRLLPVVGAVRAALAAAPGCTLARMSGSGPTCFGLFATVAAAETAARLIAAAYPAWWVVPCRTGAAT